MLCPYHSTLLLVKRMLEEYQNLLFVFVCSKELSNWDNAFVNSFQFWWYYSNAWLVSFGLNQYTTLHKLNPELRFIHMLSQFAIKAIGKVTSTDNKEKKVKLRRKEENSHIIYHLCFFCRLISIFPRNR